MGKRILVVDDTAFMRFKLKAILEKGGHVVVGEAANGQEGVEKCALLRPDLVTLDVNMPDMDGLAALKLMKEQCPEVTVVMITAMGRQEIVMDAMMAGASDFIVKPFEDEKVARAIAQLTS